MEILTRIVLGVFISIGIILIIRVKKRGFFWKDRNDKEVSVRQFVKRYKDGIVNITPLQQTQTTMWSFIPIFAGLIWGITVMVMAGTWWMVLILGGSLPIISVQFIANLQKLKALKRVKLAMDEAMGIKPKKTKKKKRKGRKKK